MLQFFPFLGMIGEGFGLYTNTQPYEQRNNIESE